MTVEVKERPLRRFKVGTFDDGRIVSAYTVWYNPKWDGCIEFTVDAVNGEAAKKEAIRLRKELRK